MEKALNLKTDSNKALLIIAFLEGFSVLGIELCSHRIIAPIFGSNVIIWITVLSSTTLALATGYYIGSHLIKKNKEVSITKILLAISAWGAISIMALPSLYEIFNRSDNFIYAALWLELILFFIPLTLFGLLPTIIIDKIKNNNNSSGTISSKVFFISTIGAIAGCYFFGFMAIPKFGVKNSLLLISILIILSSFQLKGAKRFQLIKLAFLIIPVISYFKSNSKTSHNDILFASEGLLGQIIVGDFQTNYNQGGETDRILFVNRMGQTWVDKQNESRWPYVNYLQIALSKYGPKSNVLLLGLGGGTVANRLTRNYGFDVDVVEIDNRIKEVAHKYFDLPRRINVSVDDARHYINSTDKKYDAIIVDLFKGEVPPAHVLSIEAFRDMGRLLKPNGTIIANFNGFISGKKGIVGRSLFKTLERAGYFVKILPTSTDENQRNNLFIATNQPKDFKEHFVLLHGQPISISTLFLNTNFKEDYIILTEDKSKLEYLNVELGQQWRKSYQQTFNKEFNRVDLEIVN